MDPRKYLAILLALALGVGLTLGGCSESTRPAGDGTAGKGAALVEGTLDPGGQTFLLQALDDPPPGMGPIPVRLIGSNLDVDPVAETVSLDVAIRNVGPRPLYAPAMVYVARLMPPEVTVTNADVVLDGPPPAAVVPGDPGPVYGFNYSQLLGDDDILSPDETSASRTWIFHVPGLTSFSFAARAEFGLVPDLPRIAGRCFVDLNRDGQPQPHEPPFRFGVIAAAGPGGFQVTAHPDPLGRYLIPVTEAGLYTLRFVPGPYLPPPPPTGSAAGGSTGDDPADADDDPDDGWADRLVFTTPNPLQVMLPPGPDGSPASFLGAHFGVWWPQEDGHPPIVLSNLPPDSLQGDFYRFLGGRVTGNILRLRVGFSGCSPDHPFTLYAAGPVMESYPPQVFVVLDHDDRGELCDAFWERELSFDLRPLRRWMQWPGPIVLVLLDHGGDAHRFIYGPWPPPDRP